MFLKKFSRSGSMKQTFVKIVAFFVSMFTLIPSVFGLPSVYSKYDNPEKYDSTRGQIVVDTDMSVPRIFLIQNKSSDYVIVRGENASPAEITAAETLQDYLNQITSVTLSIVTDSTPEQSKEIVIGKTNREGSTTYTIDRNKLGDDGLKVVAYNEKLIIAGGEQRGTLYGVYTFLEEILGCRWFTPKLTVVPKSNDVSVRRSINIEQIPILYYREHDWKAAGTEDWCVAQKINGTGVFRNISEEKGSGVKYTGPFFVHTVGLLLPESKYFAEHPEYYAYTGGKRDPIQLCLTNPDVLRLVTESALEELRKKPDADIISISQNDGEGYCECDNCKALDEKEGTHMGTMLNFVNAVAEEIEKEFPDVMVDTLAYVYTRVPPKNIKPRKNVIIRLCSFESCFSHPLSECNVDKTGRSFSEDLDAWREVCDNIYIWDYTTNFSHYLTIYPNMHVFQDNMQYFAESNAKGVFAEGNPHLEHNGEFSHLKTYLLAKLLWDPYTDIEKHTDEFMRAFYGEGFQNIRKFIDFTSERAKLKHIRLNSKPLDVLFLSTADVKACDKWWDAAEEAAKTETELANVKASRIQLRYYKNYARLDEFSLLRNNAKTGEEFYEALMTAGINKIHLSRVMKDKEDINFRERASTWSHPKFSNINV